jgi:hypothetical protein
MRYILLLALNLPVILLALMNIITQFKLKKISRSRFRIQVALWLVILIILVSSFPLYNLMSSLPPLDSSELSLFDIVEVTLIVILIYSLNNQRRKIEHNEKTIRTLHQELSIRLSADEDR